MCKVDLTDDYLMVAINDTDKKYLRFIFNDQMYQFNSLPFGLSSSPFVFTKIMRPVLNYLRSKGIIVVAYLELHSCLQLILKKNYSSHFYVT